MPPKHLFIAGSETHRSGLSRLTIVAPLVAPSMSMKNTETVHPKLCYLFPKLDLSQKYFRMVCLDSSDSNAFLDYTPSSRRPPPMTPAGASATPLVLTGKNISAETT